jgi:hypothetical protein
MTFRIAIFGPRRFFVAAVHGDLTRQPRGRFSESATTPSVTLRRTTNARLLVFLGTFARLAQQIWLRATTSRIPPPGFPPLCAQLLPAPRTTATANSFFRSSTASTRHSSEVGFPPPASSSSQDQQPTRPSPIPSQRRLTQQLLREHHTPKSKSAWKRRFTWQLTWRKPFNKRNSLSLATCRPSTWPTTSTTTTSATSTASPR